MNEEDRFGRARGRLIEEARSLLRDGQSMADFFRAFMALTRDLAGDDGLLGTDLDIFQRLEAWEQSVGDDKTAGEAALRMALSDFVPPDSYQRPTTAWVVEYSDPREPELTFQAGAFTSETEASQLLKRIQLEGRRSNVRLNIVPVHQTLADWEWDR